MGCLRTCTASNIDVEATRMTPSEETNYLAPFRSYLTV